jgi:predicted nuclease of predicted toxin-antitoxin system
VSWSLQQEGHDSVHVRDIGFAQASDEIIFDRAERENRILVSADTDFGTILALRGSRKPSLILFRSSDKRPRSQAQTLLANLSPLAKSLDLGAVVVIEDARIRVRSLPIGEGKE